MPLYPNGPKYGLSLWNSIPATMIVEGAMFVAGLFLYVRGTRAVDRVGRWALVSLGATLGALYIADALGGAAPPSVTAICVVALIAAVVFPAWAWLADRHRTAT
jgi:hypothetical protein